MDIYAMRAELTKALAHPTRLRILDLLLDEGEKCVCEIVEKMDMGQPVVSKHLAVLRDAGIVESRKEGLMVFYRAKTTCVKGFFSCIDRLLREDLERRQSQLEGVSKE